MEIIAEIVRGSREAAAWREVALKKLAAIQATSLKRLIICRYVNRIDVVKSSYFT